MTKESLLMQYQSECRNALESVVNVSKSFQKVFMDAIKWFMAIPGRINFLQMGRYGCLSEQITVTILRMTALTGFPSMKPSSWNTLKASVRDSRWSVFHSKIRQQNAVDWLFLVWLCQWIQLGTGNNWYLGYRRWQSWMYDFGVRADTWQHNAGKPGEEPCGLVRFLSGQ